MSDSKVVSKMQIGHENRKFSFSIVTYYIFIFYSEYFYKMLRECLFLKIFNGFQKIIICIKELLY